MTAKDFSCHRGSCASRAKVALDTCGITVSESSIHKKTPPVDSDSNSMNRGDLGGHGEGERELSVEELIS